MKTVKEALAKADIVLLEDSNVLHQMGNSLNTDLHSCYEDAGVTPEQHKKAVHELIKSREELIKSREKLKVIFQTIKEMMFDDV